MIWDNWELPVKDNGYAGESCKDLAIYFINILMFKRIFDDKFKIDYPQKEKEPEQSYEEYNNYLTQHLNAYRDLLNKQNIQYMQDADVHLHDKLTSITYDNQLITHPQLGNTINDLNLVPMLCCLSLYEFDDLLQKQEVGIRHKSIQQKRSNPVYNFITDISTLFSIVRHNLPDLQIVQMISAKSNPSFISKLTQKYYFSKYKYFGNVQPSTIEWLQK
jgi:hypothetical protein